MLHSHNKLRIYVGVTGKVKMKKLSLKNLSRAISAMSNGHQQFNGLFTSNLKEREPGCMSAQMKWLDIPTLHERGKQTRL